MSYPQLLFGGSGIGKGSFSTPDQVKTLLNYLASKNVQRIDTAALYPLENTFKSESALGESGLINRGLLADTKILLSPDFTGNGALTKSKIDDSVNGSFQRLQGKINVLYCHAPDFQTPLSETVAALQDQFDAGHFSKLGLSNYTPELIENFLTACGDRQNIKPSVVQGQYNVLCRGAEARLIPFLRKHGISYIAFSPLAGGFLTGNLTSGGDLAGTRFEDGNISGSFLRASFDKPSMHSAIKKLQEEFAPRGIGLVEASLRWLCYHSMLGKDDSIILGASSMKQLEMNMDAIGKGPLDEGMLSVLDEVWEMVKANAPL